MDTVRILGPDYRPVSFACYRSLHPVGDRRDLEFAKDITWIRTICTRK